MSMSWYSFLFLDQNATNLKLEMKVMRGPMILLCDDFFYSSSASLWLITYRTDTAITEAALFPSFFGFSIHELGNDPAVTGTILLFGTVLKHFNCMSLMCAGWLRNTHLPVPLWIRLFSLSFVVFLKSKYRIEISWCKAKLHLWQCCSQRCQDR